ncbi:hypothetical protein ONE63_010667 [Megalurothrips usitatus]|uniref:RanBP2-type domain-containing protein n=1 Tax=Megalurothrips usitatus TaxID=439358 RepID=A0AAV7XHR8_9NEOP|nr:hypothetical protein ONE63_010667 [Megalurothrips usitatus]
MDPHVLARAEELSLQINRLHVSYLQADESPQKIEQRTKLENYIRKYLCLVAHGRKFIFPETAEILRRSVEVKGSFSAYRASTAWNAIARYAANIVAQPWRKEFRVIKTFSGFYMHDVEENLAYAERLLDCMGYRRLDHSSLVLEQPIDLDAVINVSRDAIVAFVECQIMKEIWEGVYPQFECSWLEILNFRESHIGSPESAIKSFSYMYHQNCFPPQQMLSAGVPHDSFLSNPRFQHHSPQSNCLYGPMVSPHMNVPYYGYASYPACALPAQPRFACVVNPQQMMGYSVSPASYNQHAKSPAQVLPLNGYNYSHSSGMPSSSGHNGYVIPQSASNVPQSYNCVVPTGQLIELDTNSAVAPLSRPSRISMPPGDDTKHMASRNGNNVGSSERSGNLYSDVALCERESPTSARSDSKSTRPTTLDDLKPRKNGIHNDHMSPSGEEPYTRVDKHGANKQTPRHSARKSGGPVAPMQDGTGTWESWDYVYRNLASQGYNKDVGERGDILHSTFPRRGSIGSAGSSPIVNSTVVRNSRNVQDIDVPDTLGHPSHLSQLSDGIQSLRLKFDDPSSGRGLDTVDTARNGIRDPKGISAKEKMGGKSANAANKFVARDPKREADATFSSILKNGNAEDEVIEFWECVFCTYHNKHGTCVCEMCGKSRQPGNEEKPLISGGRECPKCTLVNARGVVSCEACNESLKNSPTYI